VHKTLKKTMYISELIISAVVHQFAYYSRRTINSVFQMIVSKETCMI